MAVRAYNVPAFGASPERSLMKKVGGMTDRTAQAMTVYVGGYSDPDRDGRGAGIEVFDMDAATGTLTLVQTVADIANPSFLALHPTRPFLYSVNGGNATGASAFSIEPSSGRLTPINNVSSLGNNPAYIAVDPTGHFVLLANYSGGSASVVPIRDDGGLREVSHVIHHAGPRGPVDGRQNDPHPHMILPDPSGRFVLVNDLGVDRTYVYRLDITKGTLVPHDPPWVAAVPGGGPRHLAFHPNGRRMSVINELNSTITTFNWSAELGLLSPIQTISTLPDGNTVANSTAQIVVHPSGRFLYGSNRGHDSIAIFESEPESGMLALKGTEPTRGRTPRNFNIDPSGTFLFAANQDTDTVVTFRSDTATGGLTPTGQVLAIGSPSCVIFRPRSQ